MRSARCSSQTGRAVFCALAVLFFLAPGFASILSDEDSADSQNPVKHLSLAELGNIEVTTASREPERVVKTTAAIYVITQEDIERSGALTIPDALRLAPGVEVAQIDSHTGSVGIRGFGSNLTTFAVASSYGDARGQSTNGCSGQTRPQRLKPLLEGGGFITALNCCAT